MESLVPNAACIGGQFVELDLGGGIGRVDLVICLKNLSLNSDQMVMIDNMYLFFVLDGKSLWYF